VRRLYVLGVTGGPFQVLNILIVGFQNIQPFYLFAKVVYIFTNNKKRGIFFKTPLPTVKTNKSL